MVDMGPVADLDPVGLLDQDIERLEQFFESLEGADWSRGTRCAGWGRREVLAHLAGADAYHVAGIDNTLDEMIEAAEKAGVTDLDSFNLWQVNLRADRSTGEVLDEWRRLNRVMRDGFRRLGEEGTVATMIGPYPARMQAFRQREYVYLGDPDGAEAHRDEWVKRGVELMSRLGLAVEAVVANDPFFGRVGRMLAANQREETLKYEIVTPIANDDRPTAIMSANCHRDHFGLPFGIETADGAVAHTACVGFGVERITLALLRAHGLEPARWPAEVRHGLWP